MFCWRKGRGNGKSWRKIGACELRSRFKLGGESRRRGGRPEMSSTQNKFLHLLGPQQHELGWRRGAADPRKHTKKVELACNT